LDLFYASLAWQSAYKKSVSTGIASIDKEHRFSFHDIKAKARYMRETKEVEATK
jgi:hypothetical protein